MDERRQTAWIELGEADGIRRVPLVADRPCRIGRSKSSAIVLNDEQVSRNHAMIQPLGAGSYALVDLVSVNGTYVGGRRIGLPTVLRSGERITIGRTELRFHQEDPAGPAPETDSGELHSTNVYYAEKLITVLVADIRGYTQLAQKLEADALSQLLRTFFSEGGKPLFAAGSWEQKYIGDAVMAVWIHDKPDVLPADELMKILNALMRLADVAAELQHRFGLGDPIRVGAGLNTGRASVGNVGSIAAADYTAVGDVVNKAFRLESATREAHCDLLVGRETLDLLQRQPEIAELFTEYTVSLKGYEEGATAWGAHFGPLARGLSAAATSRNRSGTCPA